MTDKQYLLDLDRSIVERIASLYAKRGSLLTQVAKINEEETYQFTGAQVIELMDSLTELSGMVMDAYDQANDMREIMGKEQNRLMQIIESMTPSPDDDTTCLN